MSTCQELDDQIAAKLTALGEVNSQISDKAGEIDDMTLICIADDTYPNGSPAIPFTEMSIDMRVSYLQMYAMMHPALAGAIALLIEKYNKTTPTYGVKTLIQQKAGLQSQASALQMDIQNLRNMKTSQGCP